MSTGLPHRLVPFQQFHFSRYGSDSIMSCMTSIYLRMRHKRVSCFQISFYTIHVTTISLMVHYLRIVKRIRERQFCHHRKPVLQYRYQINVQKSQIDHRPTIFLTKQFDVVAFSHHNKSRKLPTKYSASRSVGWCYSR
jgi:hypothetical protein